MNSSSSKRTGSSGVDEKLLDLLQTAGQPTLDTDPTIGQTVEGSSSEQVQLPLQASYGNAAVSRKLIQRKTEGEGVSEPAIATSESQPLVESSATGNPASGLVVDDDVETLVPGQMRKTEFLSLLRTTVTSTAEEALAGTTWSAVTSPYIDGWFGIYRAKSGQQIEQAIRRYAPEATQVTSATGFVSVVTTRVRRSIDTWVATGQMPGGPEGAPMGLPDAGMLGTAGGAVAGAASGVAAGIASSVESAASALGSVFFKAREGGAEAGDPERIQSRLGAGQALEGGVRSRMESAFGQSFAGVRVHTDANASGLSSDLNARALTVGRHVAFSAGEYQPGTLVGDALIAHELAHVLQQREEGALGRPAPKNASAYHGLEHDADDAAVGAVVSLWGGGRRGLAKLPKRVLPRLKSGLRLQMDKCGCSPTKKDPIPIPPPTQNQTYEEWLKSFTEYEGTGDRDITGLAPQKLKDYITGTLGVPPDCADVSLLLRHYYLESQGKTFTFKAGPEKKEFKIGAGVSDADVGHCMVQLGTINFQEDRGGGFRLANFYKQGGTRIRNLKALLDAGLKPGDLLVWKRLPHLRGNFEGHVQTVQAVDRARGLLTVVQGNMFQGAGVGALEQRRYTFLELTGDSLGDADIKDAREESFYGAGPWME